MKNGTKRRAWTSVQVRELKSMARKKTPAARIAKKLKRSLGATRQKAFSMGLSLDTPRLRYAPSTFSFGAQATPPPTHVCGAFSFAGRYHQPQMPALIVDPHFWKEALQDRGMFKRQELVLLAPDNERWRLHRRERGLQSRDVGHRESAQTQAATQRLQEGRVRTGEVGKF